MDGEHGHLFTLVKRLDAGNVTETLDELLEYVVSHFTHDLRFGKWYTEHGRNQPAGLLPAKSRPRSSWFDRLLGRRREGRSASERALPGAEGAAPSSGTSSRVKLFTSCESCWWKTMR